MHVKTRSYHIYIHQSPFLHIINTTSFRFYLLSQKVSLPLKQRKSLFFHKDAVVIEHLGYLSNSSVLGLLYMGLNLMSQFWLH